MKCRILSVVFQSVGNDKLNKAWRFSTLVLCKASIIILLNNQREVIVFFIDRNICFHDWVQMTDTQRTSDKFYKKSHTLLNNNRMSVHTSVRTDCVINHERRKRL